MTDERREERGKAIWLRNKQLKAIERAKERELIDKYGTSADKKLWEDDND